MSLDGKILARARARLTRIRNSNQAETDLRRSRAYAKNPAIEEIDTQLRLTVAQAMAAAFSGGDDPAEAVERVGKVNLELQKMRRDELEKCGLPRDYLDEGYICPFCRDTGYVGPQPCQCLMDIYADEQRQELSALLKLGSETFDSFDLMKYPDNATENSPRAAMEVVYETCVTYALKFSPASPNLFFTGGTGLGKTFLSTCIAKEVADKGCSVVYDTAGSVFAKYEGAKFSRSDADMADVRRYETCDLLIVDDLGTEMTTAFVTSALYTLINTRLTTGKKTIISSNLTPQAVYSRYSAAVGSRLSGEFTVLTFYGKDIRTLNDGE